MMTFLFSTQVHLATYWHCLRKLLVEPSPEFEESLPYRTLADCRPFHPVQAECFQGTGAWLNCSIHTSSPRSDEASESHATGLDRTWHSKEVCHASHTIALSPKQFKAAFRCIFGLDQCRELTVTLVTPLVWIKRVNIHTGKRSRARFRWQTV